MASLAEKRMEDAEERPVDPNTETDAVARPEELRLLEALLFASAEPIDQATLAKRMPAGPPEGFLAQSSGEQRGGRRGREGRRGPGLWARRLPSGLSVPARAAAGARRGEGGGRGAGDPVAFWGPPAAEPESGAEGGGE